MYALISASGSAVQPSQRPAGCLIVPSAGHDEAEAGILSAHTGVPALAVYGLVGLDLGSAFRAEKWAAPGEVPLDGVDDEGESPTRGFRGWPGLFREWCIVRSGSGLRWP